MRLWLAFAQPGIHRWMPLLWVFKYVRSVCPSVAPYKRNYDGFPHLSLLTPGLYRLKNFLFLFLVYLWLTWILVAPKQIYFLEINHLVWLTPQIKFMSLFPNLTTPGPCRHSRNLCQSALLVAYAGCGMIPVPAFMLSHTSEAWREAECLLFWGHLKPGMQRVPSHFQVCP